MKKYRVELTVEEQEELKALVSRGRAAAYKQTHARILLLSDENQAEGPMMDQEIARSLKVGTATVERVRRRCVEEGVAAALGRKEQLNRRRKKLDGQGEAHLIALACSPPPEGRVSWTLQLLADGLVEGEIRGEHQRRDGAPDLEKNQLKPWLKECWCLPPQGSSRVCMRHGRRAGGLSPPAMKTRKFWCAWTRPASNWWGRLGNPVRRGLVQSWPTIMNTSATG